MKKFLKALLTAFRLVATGALPETEPGRPPLEKRSIHYVISRARPKELRAHIFEIVRAGLRPVGGKIFEWP
jgi:hypothetical protein